MTSDFPNLIFLVSEEFLKQIAAQLDIIFSRDHLINDSLYLLLDIDSFLPLKTIADLGEIKALTSDQEIVKKALPFTTNIVVDEHREMLKPTFKISQRNTIILRDIPSDVSSEVRISFEFFFLRSFYALILQGNSCHFQG